MKILIDARLYGLEHAGIGRYVNNLVANLPLVDKKNKYTLILRDKYYKSKDIPISYNRIRGDFQHYSLKEQIFLPKIIKSEKNDLVHFPHFNVPLKINSPFVVTIHDMLMHRQKGFDATTLNPVLYTLKRLGYYRVFKKAIIKSSKIIVPSNVVKDELLNAYDIENNKIIVTYEGLDQNIHRQKAPIASATLKKFNVKKPYFIYAGSAYPHKNLYRAIEATSQLNKSMQADGAQVYLVLITSKTVFTNRLKSIVNELGAKNWVNILGFVDDSELSALYQESVGFLYPSLSEGFGLPGLEALSVGTMALVSDIPIFKEIYKDAAYYFNPFDYTSIQKAMGDVLKLKKENRKKYDKNASKVLKKYSWKKMAKETTKIYETAIG